ncbi:hypothetical protein [Streptomyces litchfieldiae]|uniref:Uncharacterized protein n=1 Tax=Streptomyces litchfieldiae TaxID=3075543 RepID=A0ABU2MQH4_9ACTN|nr:hypothetical protein [Streptomyces sp. DSM 44938]MDT0343880.1 hypothetical protein [Streptomyces sp. DSM 44938]
MDTDIARARGVYGRLIDPDATGFGARLDVTPDDRADEVSLRLSRLFGERPELAGVMIRLGGRDVGVSTPARLRAAAGQANVAVPEAGMADRASLPGLSGQYRAIRFACGSAGCGAAQTLSYYDPRLHPVCAEAGHGAMELQR